jgi:hypothetical protein
MSILVLTSDTLIGTPATGNIEYNGQFFGTDSNASRAQLQRIVLSTAVASTSGTSIDFTGLPAWVKKITVMFSGVSSAGSSDLLIQLGDAGGIENTGYSSSYTQTTTTGSSTSGLILAAATSSDLWYGSVIITSFGSNTWTSIGNLTNTGAVRISAGIKATSDTLDRIRITVPSSTFDAGSINIIYEG